MTNNAIDPRTCRIAMVGFGEAGRAFVQGWGTGAKGRVSAFDIKSRTPALSAAMEDAYRTAGVAGGGDAANALAGTDIVFCLVTADQVLAATQEAAPHLSKGALWFDGNSCSPGTKRQAADLVSAAGGHYVDTAVMAPVHPKLHQTPLLLAGASASEAHEVLRQLDMKAEIAGERIGDATSIKMIRSVMIKGIEALTAECLLAARRAGVEEAVMASLQASDPGLDWRQRASYNFDRMMVHGNRRSAEMREVAATLRELGLPDRMASATASWEADVGALKLSGGAAPFVEHADRILAALKETEANGSKPAAA